MTGMTGDEIYQNFMDGYGPEGLRSLAIVMKTIARNHDERAEQIRALVARMESAWQGDAAGAAQRGAGPLAVEHDMSSMALDTAQDLTGRQAGSFSEAKGRVVPVPPKPELLNPALVFTSPAMVMDHERRVDEHDAAAQNNVDVMNGYSGASEYNTDNLPTSYGKLSDDQSGIDIGTTQVGGAGGAVIHNPGSADAGDDIARSTSAGRETSDPSGGSSGGRAPGSSPAGGSGSGSGTPGGAAGGGPGSSPGVTTPETFVPDPSASPVGSTDQGAGRGPGTSAGPLSPGLGAVVAGPGNSTRGGFGGGSSGGGAGPFGGGGAGPRGGGTPAAPGPGAGVGADPRGLAARPGAGAGALAAGARGGTAGGGFPMGAPGRGRDEEDIEHQRPEWLEGGDPDELFGTDVVTAPPTIGADD